MATEADAVDYLRQQVLTGRLSRADLLDACGNSRARLSELMAKRRAPSIEQIRRLHFICGLDASALLRPVAVDDRARKI